MSIPCTPQRVRFVLLACRNIFDVAVRLNNIVQRQK
jgi:hypothetical protein